MRICLSADLGKRVSAAIRERIPAAEIVQIFPDGRTDGEASDAEIFCFSVDLSTQPDSLRVAWKLLSAPSLRWVQAPGAGVELPIWSELVGRGVRLTTAAGLHAEPVAQYVFTQILHWNRQVERHREQQVARRWERIVSEDLTEKTIGIVGYGGIGRATARIAKAFGMRTMGLSGTEPSDPNLDAWWPRSELRALLAESHFVVLCLPLNEETRHRIGREELAGMREDAVLINVARGGVVDQGALIEVLQKRGIRGASLDVTEPEPLPEGSPLWTLPNCVLTPHDAGYSPRAGERMAGLFLENLDAFLREKEMRNEVVAGDLV